MTIQRNLACFRNQISRFEDVNPTDYTHLYNAINFVANSNDEIFKKEVSEYFDIPVLIDYQIFLEVLKPIDNCGKYVLGIYDVARDKS